MVSLLGGIPRTNVIVAQGVTGNGKTLMGLESNGITSLSTFTPCVQPSVSTFCQRSSVAGLWLLSG